ncbi:glycosyltransferase [Flavobacterium sp. TMP13]|uniref:glycosyltransferase n=1 Tax=Flavobacterium sp. TMP13 TaxID=3425950 RepID=UPI003D7784D5
MNRIEKVSIYGLCNVFYDSFYLKGLEMLFGRDRICFTTLNFPKFKENTFAIIFEYKNTKILKVVIDSRDTNLIWEDELAWCDIYGKINYDFELISKYSNLKIVPIGPSFGIKIWGLYETLFFGLKHTFKFRKFLLNKRNYLANYWRQYKRLPLEDYYHKSVASNNSVFFVSSIWKKELETNMNRLNFINACKLNNSIIFEGGFAPRSDGNNMDFDRNLILKRYNLKTYLSKTQLSKFVFNTPAVLYCHGWKLGEYLALGKVIISTKHKNELPNPLIDRVHLIYVRENVLEDYSVVLNELISNEALCKKMEANALSYFKNNLEPTVVINNLINFGI